MNQILSKLLLILATALILLSCQNEQQQKGIFLNYRIEHFDTQNDQMRVELSITNHSDLSIKSSTWELHWNQMKGEIIPSSLPQGVSFERINGDYFRLKFSDDYSLKLGETLKLKCIQSGVMDRLAMGPLGVFIVHDEKAFDLQTSIEWKEAKGVENLHFMDAEDRYMEYQDISPLSTDALSWVVPYPKTSHFNNTYTQAAPSLFLKIDDEFSKDFKNIEAGLSELIVLSDKSKSGLHLSYDNNLKSEAYTLEIKEQGIYISASDLRGVFYASQSLRQIFSIAILEDKGWPILIIEDEPRFEYRGFLLDISRNFYGKEEILKVLDLMGLYKLNTLDFRLTDDEGWRLEIPDLPELTSVGAKRSYSSTSNTSLLPMYGSGANGSPTSNGYLTREDFVEILKYAKKKQINIMPQISFPSHARAAIIAMEARYEKYMAMNQPEKALKYRLRDGDDQSEYVSAQRYTDNVICICNERAYTFFEKVYSELQNMYNDAESTIERFSIGADELPYGVWTSSNDCLEFLQHNSSNVSNLEELYVYNLKRLKKLFDRDQVKLAGWEDILLDHSEKSQSETAIRKETFNYEVIPYVWNNTWGEGREDMIYKFTNMGFKTVMSNSSAFYFDMSDDRDMDNHGLNWSGFVNYFDTWGTNPTDVFGNSYLNQKHKISDEYKNNKVTLDREKAQNLIGIQSQLWTETARSKKILEELLMPNLAIFAQRAWAPEEKWMTEKNTRKQQSQMFTAWNHFVNTIGQRSLPILTILDIDVIYHLPKPGALIENDSLTIKRLFPGMEVKYTIDGSLPTAEAETYTKPFSISKGSLVQMGSFSSTGRAGKTISIQN
tara:strand:- start:10337 stop:12841 length:2505 start_codon:yes stop_codon:yes gene_type:complete